MLGIKTRKQLIKQYEPMADYGFFGPDSVTWKVWPTPTSYILGFARAVTIEHFDPNLAAAVIQAGGVKYRPHTRYGRTLRYFGMQAFAGAEMTVQAADVLVKVHSKAIGHDPVTHGEYDANRPSSQLWIHVTAWHSILKCYEKFGPGPLTEEEENRFWAECAEAAKLQTIDPDQVPRNREEVRQFFADWRPHLAASEGAQDMIRFILQLNVALPPDMPRWKKAAFEPVVRLFSKAIVSTYPKYMRDMAGIKQGPITDFLVLYPTRALHWLMDRNIPLRLWFMNLIAPQALPVAAPMMLGIPPLSDKIWEVREAQEHFGFAVPSQAHQDLRAKQRDRVFNQGVAPSDEGLEESQAHIGSMDVHAAAKVG